MVLCNVINQTCNDLQRCNFFFSKSLCHAWIMQQMWMHIKDFIVFIYIIMYIMLIKPKNNRHFHYHYPVFLQLWKLNSLWCAYFPQSILYPWGAVEQETFILSFARKFYIKCLLCQCSCSRKDVTEKCGLKWEQHSLLSSVATWYVGLESIIYWFLDLFFHSGVHFRRFENVFQSLQCFYKVLLHELAADTLLIPCVSEL